MPAQPDIKSREPDISLISHFSNLIGNLIKWRRALAEPALVLSLPATATAFDDGLLTSSEVAQLKLNAEWVVLSACNTAAADFFYAGARALLVSYWPVESEPAVKLMTTMFAAIAENPKLTTAEALRQAMLAIMDARTNPEWANPWYHDQMSWFA